MTSSFRLNRALGIAPKLACSAQQPVNNPRRRVSNAKHPCCDELLDSQVAVQAECLSGQQTWPKTAPHSPTCGNLVSSMQACSSTALQPAAIIKRNFRDPAGAAIAQSSMMHSDAAKNEEELDPFS